MNNRPTSPESGLPSSHVVPANFDLRVFFPYQVRIYYRAVSTLLATVYSSVYGLSMSEWRTMAVLGPGQSLSSSEIVARSSMDKVNVSRAVKGLHNEGLLRRDIDGNDRRRSVLRLTEKGLDVFHAIIPQVTLLEQEMLKGLSIEERETLMRLMEKVRKNAEQAQLVPRQHQSDSLT